MRKIKIYALSLLTAGFGALSSCTEGFEELNVNPNTSTNATPDQLLAPAISDMVAANLSRSHRINAEIMQVHVSRIDSDEMHRYVIRPGESDYLWNNWYLQLTNFKDMYASAKVTQSNTYMGIAMILEAWTYSLLTDTFGDVPYTESNKGREGQLTPAFDKQETIYADLFSKLDSANTLLKSPTTTLTADQIGLDVLYGKTAGLTAANYALAWRKFGNSLYLRLLMRASAKQVPIAKGMTPAEKFKDVAETNKSNYPVFASNAESAILRYTGTVPMQSPFTNTRDYDWNGTSSMSQFFINNLKEWQDPRIAKWATLSQGVYEGIPSGYEISKIPEGRSTYPVALKTDPLLGNIMNYSELQFILAEAALKGFITGDPKTYYDAGITNGITLWGFTVPANYLDNPELKWDPAQTEEDKMEKIMVQKYYSLFFTDFQQWFEYRRTGHPVLPKGPGLRNNGQMPARFFYPVYTQTLNGTSYRAAVAAMGGPDDLNTKVWWQQ